MVLILSKSQPYGKMLTKSCTIFHGPHIYIFLMKKIPDGFFTHIFFASIIIIIFGCLFIHHLSCIYQIEFKRLKVPKAEFSEEKRGTRRKHMKAENQLWESRKKP